MTSRSTVLQAASLLLTYPDDATRALFPQIGDAVRGLGRAAGAAELLRFLDVVEGIGGQELEEHYVAVLDRRRRCCLYLTWWTEGETRRRGLALAELKAEYRAAGWELDSGELPDFLPVVLEFAARSEAGIELLRRYRPGIELLRLALQEQASPYAALVAAVGEALGGPSAADTAAALAMARTGPPTETVGVGTTRDLGPSALLTIGRSPA